MGARMSSPDRGPETWTIQREDGGVTEDVPDGAVLEGTSPRPSPELLASLHTLGEHHDHTLLPQSLHQIAEAYSLQENYGWAVQFLQLEKQYHQRLVANLAALQDSWEQQSRERSVSPSVTQPPTSGLGQEHVEMLRRVCTTHTRPTLSSLKQSVTGIVLKGTPATRGQCDKREEEGHAATSELSSKHLEQEEEEEEEGDEEEEEGEEAFEENLEEEVKLEWPAGVPQASVKDLVKLSHAEGSSSPDGLVSILKRRRASLDGLPPPGPEDAKQNCKRKVRFSEPDDGIDHDEVGGDSCLILLLLCLVTMVISVGGTALYCALVDTYSSICTDFSHNVDFYLVNVRRVIEELRQWFPLRSSP